jgi:hypothetical protein
MKPRNSAACVLGLTAALAILAGCSAGSQPPLAPSGSMKPAAVQSGVRTKPNDRGRSWMDSNARSKDLLYVSDVGQPQDVYVFAYGTAQLVGTLTGFTQVLGLCADRAGHVFVPDASSQIFEYAHGGTSPIKTLNDPSGYPDGCAVDPATGKLAVANGSGFNSTPGNLLIYANASGTPKQYTDSDFSAFNFTGYDDRGRLFVDGMNSKSNGFILAELPRGGSALKKVTLNKSVGFPGAVQWDGQFVDVGDQGTNDIYQFTIAGSSGTLEGTTHLGGATDVVEFWISRFGGGRAQPNGATVVGADFGGEYFGGQVLYWNYPAGGNPTKTITKNLSFPYGVTVSKSTK